RSERVRNAAAAVAVQMPIDPQEQAIAEQGTRLLLARYKLSQDPALLARLERIGRPIVRACPRASLPWTFQVLDTKELNAMTVGFGRIFVTRGLLELMDDDELAGAIGHEVAHGCLRHTTRPLDQAEVAKMYRRKAAEAAARAVSVQ